MLENPRSQLTLKYNFIDLIKNEFSHKKVNSIKNGSVRKLL